MELFDAHTHTVGKSTQIPFYVLSGFDLESSRNAVAYVRGRREGYASVGFHPLFLPSVAVPRDEVLSQLTALMKSPEVKAVGEIGLDYRRDSGDREKQIDWFRLQLRLAIRLKKPVILHIVKAFGDAQRILEEEGAFEQKNSVLLHSFSGSVEMAVHLVNRGAKISLGPTLMDPKNQKIRTVVTGLSPEHMLIETDAEFESPKGIESGEDSLTILESIVQRIAKLKGLPLDELRHQIFENTKQFYRIGTEE
jgi:TatD DNase family protein